MFLLTFSLENNDPDREIHADTLLQDPQIPQQEQQQQINVSGMY